MSYLFIVMIGGVAGWAAGLYFKGGEHGAGLDVAAGAIGGAVFVLIARMVYPSSTGGFVPSAIVAIIGAVICLYIMRRVTKTKAVPVTSRRRY